MPHVAPHAALSLWTLLPLALLACGGWLLVRRSPGFGELVDRPLGFALCLLAAAFLLGRCSA